MTPLERRASASLASIFALRMLGLFLVLPVFALEARHYPGGDDPARVGLAMGLYGLTQALLQLPFGMASDRFGRKPVIVFGLLLFALGSLWAALASNIQMLMIGRGLQGAGAVSAAVTALLADLTRDSVRTKAMALVGASIGLVFALSLVLAPVLAAAIGLSGLFFLTALLALLGVAVVLWVVPPVSATALSSAQSAASAAAPTSAAPTSLWRLWRLNLGVFVLHAVQLAMWVAVPALLVQVGLDKADHWQVYLPTVLASFVLMGALFALERRGYLRWVLRAAIALLLLVELGFLLQASGTPRLTTLVVLLFAFFCSFNILEASQPSLVSRLAPGTQRGTAMGIYNTLQSLGFFAGGWLGGLLAKDWGAQGLFLVAAGAVLLWLLLAWAMPVPSHTTSANPTGDPVASPR